MAEHDSGGTREPSVPTPAAGVPPPLPPPLPARRKRSKLRTGLLVIALIGAVGIAVVWTARLLFRTVNGTSARSPISEAGVHYTNDRVGRTWSIHVVQVDRSRKDLAFVAPLAAGRILGVNKISAQARAVPRAIGRAVAGVNGDFYERDNSMYAGDPRGLQIVHGELVSAPDTVCVWFDADGNPHVDEVKGDFQITWPGGRKTPFGLNEERSPSEIVLYTPTYGPSTRVQGGRDLILERDGEGPWLPFQAGQTYRARVRAVQDSADTRLPANAMVLSVGPRLLGKLPDVATGAILEISTATTPDLKGADTAIAGGPALIKDGKPFALRSQPPGSPEDYSERSKYQRHPRSAIGWSATHVYLVTVDGRQPGLSVGMTLAELAEYLVKLGCTDGMNFDGGVSASMWMSGQIVNDPCRGERAVANSLFVVRRAEAK